MVYGFGELGIYVFVVIGAALKAVTMVMGRWCEAADLGELGR